MTSEAKLTDNEIWALTEAAKPGGFMPNEASVAGFLKRLELRGLLGSSHDFVWHITDAGRSALKAMEGRDA